MRPYDAVTVRGVPIRRVRPVRTLASGRDLAWTGRAPVVDTLFNSDPLGELRIEVPDAIVDDCATVLVLDVDGAA